MNRFCMLMQRLAITSGYISPTGEYHPPSTFAGYSFCKIRHTSVSSLLFLSVYQDMKPHYMIALVDKPLQ